MKVKHLLIGLVALSDDDVKQGFATTAVLPAGKLTTTWGDVKR